MSDISSKNLLLEEYKSAFEHIRYVETKRDRYVPGIITASGAVFALVANIFSKKGFMLREASIPLVVVSFFLCSSLGLLSLILLKAYDSFSSVMKHYEGVMRVARTIIYGREGKRMVKINGEEKTLMGWVDTRKNASIRRRRTKISDLSICILHRLSIFWFATALLSFSFLLWRCYVVFVDACR